MDRYQILLTQAMAKAKLISAGLTNENFRMTKADEHSNFEWVYKFKILSKHQVPVT